MTNNQNTSGENRTAEQTKREDEGFEVSDLGQQLGGGKNTGSGEEIGGFGDDDFAKTDQSIAQAQLGQTATFENQGGSK